MSFELVAAVLYIITSLCYSAVSAQESIDAHEGFEVGKQAAISLTICFTILASSAIAINVIKKKCVKVIP